MELALIKKISRESKDYFAITFGLILYALGWAMFVSPPLPDNHRRRDGYLSHYLLCHRGGNPNLLLPYQCRLPRLCLEDIRTEIQCENHLCHLHANLPPLAFPMDTEGRKRKPAPAFRTRPRLYGMCHWSRYVGLRHRYRIL